MKTLSEQLKDWEKLGELGKMVRESSNRRRSDIISEMAKYLGDYQRRYGEIYNPLHKPK